MLSSCIQLHEYDTSPFIRGNMMWMRSIHADRSCQTNSVSRGEPSPPPSRMRRGRGAMRCNALRRRAVQCNALRRRAVQCTIIVKTI